MKEKPKKSIRAWVAREKNGALFLFCEKPKKSKSYWINSNTFTRVIIRLAQYDYKKKHFRKYTCHYQ